MNHPASALADLTRGLPSYNPDALSVKLAHDLIHSFVSPVGAVERVVLKNSLGRVLAEDIVSSFSVPAFDNSAMDGYAFSCKNLDLSQPLTLKVAGYSYAGHPYTTRVGFGECIRIMTGAMIPPGCDTVVQQENVRLLDETHLAIPPKTAVCGDNIRRAGENLAAGSIALSEGIVLRPAHLGLLASLGVAEVPVHRRVRVALLSTGDELRTAGAELDKGAVYDSNRAVLAAMMERLGCDVLDMGIVADDPVELETALKTAAENADAVITSGGVSVGAADYTRHVMANLGDVAFWSIKMRPGRPMVFGKIHSGHHNAILFGLPGNPVAVMISFYFFVRDALLHMMGATPSPLVYVKAQAASNFSKRAGRTEFQRGIVSENTDGGLTVQSTGEQGSGILCSMTEANCIIVLPEEREQVRAGEPVEIVLLEGLI